MTRRGMRGVLLALSIGCASAAWAESPVLDVDGMTFVASRGSTNELLLRAKRAVFQTDSEVADLETVHATVARTDDHFGFEIRCDRGELDLATNDFFAEGNVQGTTEGGREFFADWVRYDHADGLLYTDSPVLISEEAHRIRGRGGFRYQVREGRFRLVGGATVVEQE